MFAMLLYLVGLPRKRWAAPWRMLLWRVTGRWPWGIYRFCREMHTDGSAGPVCPAFTEEQFIEFLELAMAYQSEYPKTPS